MAKFKVGDKVKVREDLALGTKYYMEDVDEFEMVVSEMLPLKGQIVTIDKVCPDGYSILESEWYWSDEMFEPYKINFTKSDLQNGMVVEYKNGWRRLFIKKDTIDDSLFIGDMGSLPLRSFRDNLECIGCNDMSIYRIYISHSTNLDSFFDDGCLSLVWERPSYFKEMTVEEIEKELGYKIRIKSESE